MDDSSCWRAVIPAQTEIQTILIRCSFA